jgi:hypothetical protein
MYQITNFEYFFLHYDLKLFLAIYPKVNFGNMSVHPTRKLHFLLFKYCRGKIITPIARKKAIVSSLHQNHQIMFLNLFQF